MKTLRSEALYDLIDDQFRNNNLFAITERDVENQLMDVISENPAVCYLIRTHGLDTKPPPPPAPPAPPPAAPPAAAPPPAAPAGAPPAAARPSLLPVWPAPYLLPSAAAAPAAAAAASSSSAAAADRDDAPWRAIQARLMREGATAARIQKAYREWRDSAAAAAYPDDAPWRAIQARLIREGATPT